MSEEAADAIEVADIQAAVLASLWQGGPIDVDDDDDDVICMEIDSHDGDEMGHAPGHVVFEGMTAARDASALQPPTMVGP